MDRRPWLTLTLIDAVNLAVMARLGIGVAFTFDDDFIRAGFLVVPPLPR